MGIFQENYPEQTTKAAIGQMVRPQTLREQLEYRKQRMEADLADINGAITALSNPEILKALEAVQKVSRLM